MKLKDKIYLTELLARVDQEINKCPPYGVLEFNYDTLYVKLFPFADGLDIYGNEKYEDAYFLDKSDFDYPYEVYDYIIEGFKEYLEKKANE